MLTHPDRTGRTAAKAYREMSRRLNAEASKMERSGRPLTARATRFKARIAMRAAWAEETDEQPAGLGE